jgi:hypothetical protein
MQPSHEFTARGGSGGDMLNALHMRPGTAVIEVVNRYMARRRNNSDILGFQYDGWLEQHRQCLLPMQRFERITAVSDALAPSRAHILAARPLRAKYNERGPNENVSLPWETLDRALRGLLNKPDPFVKVRARELKRIATGKWSAICCVDGLVTTLLHESIALSNHYSEL